MHKDEHSLIENVAADSLNPWRELHVEPPRPTGDEGQYGEVPLGVESDIQHLVRNTKAPA